MQAFIKDNKLVINTMIQQDERPELLNYIEKIETSNIIPMTLYDVEGNISGIAFKLEEKGEQEDVR